jgi:hypothetical protein
MKIEVPLTEIVSFLKNCYNINVGLENIEEGKLKVNYLVSADLTIKKLDDDIITIFYDVCGIVDFLSKGVNLFLGKKFDDMPFEWNPKTSEIIVNLREIEDLKHLLKYFITTDIRFQEKSIVVQLSTRSTKE